MDWAKVYAGNTYTIAIKTNGTLWGWGYNSSGQLGLGDYTSRYTPTRIGQESDWVKADAGEYFYYSHTVALRSNGTLWAWGSNNYGRLGLGEITGSSSPTQIINTPTQVGADTNWLGLAVGYYHTLAIKNDGTLWSWGYNGYGQLGLGDTDTRILPTQVGQ